MAVNKGNKEEDPARGVQAGMLTLHSVSVKEAGRSLSSVYSRERRGLIEPFAEMVRAGELMASPLSATKLKGFMRDLRMDGGIDMLTETAMTQLYNSFGWKLTNVLAVAKADRRYEEAWKRLITTLEVSSMDLRQQLGREPVIASGYNWYAPNFAELLFAPLVVTDIWETYTDDYRSYLRHAVLSMPAATRCILSDLFFGREFRMPHLSRELPEGTTLLTEDFERSMVSDLMTLEGIALNGSMLAANGSVSAASMKKVKAQTGIDGFRKSSGDWPLDRVEMLCLTYFTLIASRADKNKDGIDVRQLAKFAVEQMPRRIAGPVFGTVLPAMQGFGKNWTVGSYARPIAGTVQSILMEAKEQWLSLENFRMQLMCCTLEGNSNYNYLKLFSDEARRKGKPVRKSDKALGVEGEPIDWGEEIGLRFALHWVGYLCALGIVEIAVDADSGADDSMEGMRYARLTPLGRYALGIDAEYVAKAPQRDMDVEFDALNGIVTVGSGSPFQMFLDKVAKRISPTRFRISAETLIKGCRCKKELEQRISNLRTVFDTDKYPAIRKMIDEAMLHTDCAERDGGYSLLRLRGDLPGLRELLLGNKELREMTILAGPALALVKTHRMERFNAICAAAGFLME